MSYNLQRLLVDTNKIYTHAQKKSLPLKSSSFRFSAAQSEIFFSAIFNRDESHKIKAIKNRNKFVSNCKFETTVNVNDVNLVAAIKNLLTYAKKTKANVDFWDTLSDEQKADIDAGIAELDAGKGIPHDVVMKQIKARLKP